MKETNKNSLDVFNSILEMIEKSLVIWKKINKNNLVWGTEEKWGKHEQMSGKVSMV